MWECTVCECGHAQFVNVGVHSLCRRHTCMFVAVACSSCCTPVAVFQRQGSACCPAKRGPTSQVQTKTVPHHPGCRSVSCGVCRSVSCGVCRSVSCGVSVLWSVQVSVLWSLQVSVLWSQYLVESAGQCHVESAGQCLVESVGQCLVESVSCGVRILWSVQVSVLCSL